MLKKSLKVFSKPDDGNVIEQFGVVSYGNRERLRRLDYQHHQVQRCRPMLQRKRLEYQATGVHGGPGFSMNEGGRALLRKPVRLIQHEHDLANGRAAEVASRLQSFNQQQRGKVLMLEGSQHRLAHMAYELLESRIPGEIYPQENRISKKTDDLFELGAAPAYYRRAHHQVGLTRPVMKHRLERRKHDYIERRPRSLREPLQPPTQFVVQNKIIRSTAMR